MPHVTNCKVCHNTTCPDCELFQPLQRECPQCQTITMHMDEDTRCKNDCFQCPNCETALTVLLAKSSRKKRYKFTCKHCDYDYVTPSMSVTDERSISQIVDHLNETLNVEYLRFQELKKNIELGGGIDNVVVLPLCGDDVILPRRTKLVCQFQSICPHCYHVVD